MIASRLLRPLLVAGALGSALAAQATFLSLESSGYRLYGGSLFHQETVTSQSGGLGTLTSLSVKNVGADFSASYTGPSGDLNLSLIYVGGEFHSNGGYGTTRYFGDWRVTGGSGAYAGVYGGGIWEIDAVDSPPFGSHAEDTRTTLSGAIAPVPEPASLAALGLGAAAIMRRRRKV